MQTEKDLNSTVFFDKYGYPQAFVNGRSFDEGGLEGNRYRGMPESVRMDEEILAYRGKYATCDIVVESRRNATWQGIVGDSYGNVLDKFECVLDIMKILEVHLG